MGSPWASNCGFPLCVGTNTFLQICRLNNLLCWVAMEFHPLRVRQTPKLPKSSVELKYFLCLFSPPTFLQPPLGTTYKFHWCIITWPFPLSVKLLTSPPDLILMKSWPALRREVKQTWKGALWNSASSGSKKLWFSHITIWQKIKIKQRTKSISHNLCRKSREPCSALTCAQGSRAVHGSLGISFTKFHPLNACHELARVGTVGSLLLNWIYLRKSNLTI